MVSFWWNKVNQLGTNNNKKTKLRSLTKNGLCNKSLAQKLEFKNSKCCWSFFILKKVNKIPGNNKIFWGILRRFHWKINLHTKHLLGNTYKTSCYTSSKLGLGARCQFSQTRIKLSLGLNCRAHGKSPLGIILNVCLGLIWVWTTSPRCVKSKRI